MSMHAQEFSQFTCPLYLEILSKHDYTWRKIYTQALIP